MLKGTANSASSHSAITVGWAKQAGVAGVVGNVHTRLRATATPQRCNRILTCGSNATRLHPAPTCAVEAAVHARAAGEQSLGEDEAAGEAGANQAAGNIGQACR